MEKITKGHALSQSADIVKENLETLKRLFPTIVKEGKIDVEELKALLDEDIETNEEYYRFTWAGKNEARREANKPSTATLRPCKEESKNWETTGNIFIEGDNLEVLKLLQKSYAGKIKVMYFDPPYNTGKDFVYKDNYADNLSNYFELTGQTDEEGKKLSTNPESSGRYHSNWLNMIYPRLKLSRNLLADDGVIFISINDKEVLTLKIVLNEIFGEENFLACLIWDKNHSAQAGVFKVYHEYVLVYSNVIDNIGAPSSSDTEHFEAGAMKRESNRHANQSFDFPAGVRFDAPNGFELKGAWGDVEKVELLKGEMVCENGKTKYPITLRAPFTQKNQMQQFFYGDKENLLDSRGQKIVEFYFNSSGKIKVVKERGVYTPATTLNDYGTQSGASNDLASLFGLSETPIDNPKPVKLISDFILWFSKDEDLVLDIFAGSGTTAHAVMQLNSNFSTNRKFICVQIPELLEDKSEPFKAGYYNISELCKERMRRAGEKIKSEATPSLFSSSSKLLDVGFKVFKLDFSNINAWNGSVENLDKNLFNAVSNIKENRTEEDVLYEILLKYGLDLSVPIEEKEVNNCKIYCIGAGVLFVCLSDKITTIVAEAIGKWKEELQPATCRALFKDNGFADDIAKTNCIQILKQYGIEETNSI